MLCDRKYNGRDGKQYDAKGDCDCEGEGEGKDDFKAMINSWNAVE